MVPKLVLQYPKNKNNIKITIIILFFIIFFSYCLYIKYITKLTPQDKINNNIKFINLLNTCLY